MEMNDKIEEEILLVADKDKVQDSSMKHTAHVTFCSITSWHRGYKR